jgi:hypothetical protein
MTVKARVVIAALLLRRRNNCLYTGIAIKIQKQSEWFGVSLTWKKSNADGKYANEKTKSQCKESEW